MSHAAGSAPSRGFTLIEVALVVAIIAVLLGGMLVPMRKRIQMQAYVDTQAKLEAIQEALVGYATLNRRLPCPGATANGAELVPTLRTDATTTTLTCGSDAAHSDAFRFNSVTNVADSQTNRYVSWGYVPWQTLGLSQAQATDAWQQRIRYAVLTRLVRDNSFNATTLSAAADAGIRLIDGNQTPSTLPPANNLATQALLVIYTLGEEGEGASMVSNPPDMVRTAPTSVDEIDNLPELQGTASARMQFVSRLRSDEPTNPAVQRGRFDDVLIWLSPTTLTAKLVSAGVWTP